MQRKIIFKKIALSLALFFFIFPPHILVFGLVFKVLYLSIVLPSIFGFFLYISNKIKVAPVTVTIFTLSVAFFFFLSMALTHGVADYQINVEIANGFVILFAAFFYVKQYIKLYDADFIRKLFSDLHFAGFVQAVVVICTFIFPSFRDFLYSIVSITETANRYLFLDVEVRRFQGIVPSGFSFLSTTHALLMICGLWEFSMDNAHSRRYLVKFFLYQVAIFLSIFLIGRTGLIVVIVFVASTFVILSFERRCPKDRRFHLNCRELILPLLLASPFLVLLLMSVDLNYYYDNLKFAFELFISLYTDGELDRTLSGVLNDHYFLPSNLFDLFFGTGNFGRGEHLNYIDSDVGYILFIHGSGFLGLVIAYVFYMVGLYYACINYRRSRHTSSYLIVMIFVLYIANMKDYYYISHVGYSQIYFILVCSIALYKIKKVFDPARPECERRVIA